MANVREAYAATALANLDWSPFGERPIDRVAAAGRADAFGVLLWRAKYQSEASAYAQARTQLIGYYGKRYRDNQAIATALVDQGFREYLAPACRQCHGVGEMLIGQLRAICESCGGSKIHRFGDFERAGTMQISYAMTKKCAHKIRWILQLLCDADREVNTVMCRELEKNT